MQTKRIYSMKSFKSILNKFESCILYILKFLIFNKFRLECVSLKLPKMHVTHMVDWIQNSDCQWNSVQIIHSVVLFSENYKHVQSWYFSIMYWYTMQICSSMSSEYIVDVMKYFEQFFLFLKYCSIGVHYVNNSMQAIPSHLKKMVLIFFYCYINCISSLPFPPWCQFQNDLNTWVFFLSLKWSKFYTCSWLNEDKHTEDYPLFKGRGGGGHWTMCTPPPPPSLKKEPSVSIE